MMQIGTTANGHEMVIYETFQDGWVHGLDFFCRTCDDGEVFEREDYGKYRLAMEAARNAAHAHAGVDTARWHLVES